MIYEKPKPRKAFEQSEPQPCQHVRILDCDKPVSRIFYECYHCLEGLLSEYSQQPPVQETDVRCPSCGKTAIKLITNDVLSTTIIPSPWRE